MNAAATPASSAAPPADADVHREDTGYTQAPGEAAALLEPLLLAVAAPGATLLSTTFDYAPPADIGETVTAEAWIEHTTRTLAFAHARLLHTDGRVLVTCSAVLRNAAEA